MPILSLGKRKTELLGIVCNLFHKQLLNEFLHRSRHLKNIQFLHFFTISQKYAMVVVQVSPGNPLTKRILFNFGRGI